MSSRYMGTDGLSLRDRFQGFRVAGAPVDDKWKS